MKFLPTVFALTAALTTVLTAPASSEATPLSTIAGDAAGTRPDDHPPSPTPIPGLKPASTPISNNAQEIRVPANVSACDEAKRTYIEAVALLQETLEDAATEWPTTISYSEDKLNHLKKARDVADELFRTTIRVEIGSAVTPLFSDKQQVMPKIDDLLQNIEDSRPDLIGCLTGCTEYELAMDAVSEIKTAMELLPETCGMRPSKSTEDQPAKPTATEGNSSIPMLGNPSPEPAKGNQ